MTEVVTVIAGGRRYALWEEISVDYGAEQAVRAARLVTADAASLTQAAWPLLPGTDVEVYAGNTLLIRGFVETFEPQVTGQYHVAVVTVVTKSKDAVEASATHPTGEVRNRRIHQLAHDIDPTGTVWRSQDGKTIPLIRVKPGETVFEAVERAAKAHGVLLIGAADGGVDIVRGVRGRHNIRIRTQDYVQAQSRLSIEGRHDVFKVKGQSAETLNKNGQVPEATATVPLPRPRPKVHVLEGEANPERLKGRAEWLARREAGAALTATIVVPFWRDDSGRIWEPAFTVFVDCDLLKIHQDMAIKHVSLSQGGQPGQGTRATLTLTDPRGLGEDGGAGGSSDKAYGVPIPKVKPKATP